MLYPCNCLMTIRRLTHEDQPELQALLENCSDFLEFQDDGPVQSSAAMHLLEDRPEGAAPEDKTLLGIFGDEVCGLIGVVDLVKDSSQPGAVSMGLMLLDPQCRGRGVGTQAYEQVEAWARSTGVHTINLGVLSGNDRGLAFWKRCGYSETGEMGRYRSKSYAVLEKRIAGSP